jgi:tetratricopeptide (TPR) repeat protein
MPNRQTDILFQLIKSLEKAEKRHFKLYIKRSSGNSDLKIIRLFDVIDKLKEFDDSVLIKKMGDVTRPQLGNLKAHLYKQILASLRLLKSSDSIDLQLNEQFDYAHILYKKGLFLQSLRILDRAKELARANQKFNFLPQIISLEKRIEGLHITRSMQNRAEQLSAEANEVSRHIDHVARLSNLALQLYSWYIQHGHARNEEDEEDIRAFMKAHLPKDAWQQTGFYEKLYLYQSFCWFAFIRQDFLQYYKYTKKWVSLFEEQPLMVRVETGHYIKGLHNLLNAHFDLRNFKEFEKTLKVFEKFAETERVKQHDNFRIQAFIYINIARINQHFIMGTFKEGLKLVPEIEYRMEEYHLFVDQHRILVLNYKIAMLYFGSGNYNACIDYLQKIINEKTDLRYDLQCYARVVHLLAHYELGNDMLMESLSKSVYRFMAKMANLTVVEEAMFKFLRQSIPLSPRQLKPEFEKFLQSIKHLEKNRFETRAFAYLDIISWVESKVYETPMSIIIHEKYLQSRHR